MTLHKAILAAAWSSGIGTALIILVFAGGGGPCGPNTVIGAIMLMVGLYLIPVSLMAWLAVLGIWISGRVRPRPVNSSGDSPS